MLEIQNFKSGQHISGLVQERSNSIANALELHLSCTNPSVYAVHWTRMLLRSLNCVGNVWKKNHIDVFFFQKLTALDLKFFFPSIP